MNPLPAGVLSPWLKGAIFFAAWAIGLIVMMRITYAHLRQLSRRTRTDLEDIILGVLSVPLVIVILVSGGLILTKFLPLSPAWDRGLNLGVKIAFILAGVFFVDRLIKSLLLHYSARADYLKASFGIVQIAMRAVMLLLTLLIILDMAGVSITPLLASLGVGSLALALALQAPLVNFFAGLQLVADKPIQVGQYIKMDSGEEGTVTRIGWRATVITSTYLLKHEFIKRLHRRYKEEGIAFPLPIRAIHAKREDLLLLKGTPTSSESSIVI